MAAPRPARSPARARLPLLVAGCILLFTALLFSPSLTFDYVNLDDPGYVTLNPGVRQGLTWQGLVAAFHERDLGLYTPLTRISHMLDTQLFGLAPAGHHATNLLLHLVSTLLLFVILFRCTGHLWTTALATLIFSLHPLRVESVAWIAERKDVLSLAFGLAAILAYVAYARRCPFRVACYFLCAACLAASLMAKPMFVTLPAILLILDFWPLQRLTLAAAWRCLLEKIPFGLLSLAAMAIILRAPLKPGDVTLHFTPPLSWRLGNACISPMVYLGQTLCPVNLGALYLFHPVCPPRWEVAACGASLIALTFGAFLLARRMPYLLAGWLWFLTALIPVLGLIPMGSDRHADRYTYFPGIGLAVALAWSLRALAQLLAARAPSRPDARGRAGLRVPALCAATLLLLSSMTFDQLFMWQDSETLWRTTTAHCGETELAHIDLAHYLREKGRYQEALAEASAAVRMGPFVPLAHLNLANCLMSLREPSQAVREYQAALSLEPANAESHANLGAALLSLGRDREGIAEIQEGLRLDPTQEKARKNLQRALGKASATPAS